MKPKISSLFVLFLVLFVILIWSVNFIAISYLVKEVEPYTALTFRFIAVSIILMPFLLKKQTIKDFIYLVLSSLALGPGHFGLLFMSIEYTKSLSGISILIQLAIPFSIILSWLLFKDKVSKLRLFGLIIAFIGMFFLLYNPDLLSSRKAFFIATASALCMGIYFILVKKIKNTSAFGIIAWTSFLSIPMMYVFMFLNNQSMNDFYNIELNTTIYSFFYVVIGSSILGHGIWAYLLKIEDISFLTPFLLLVPLFTSILSIVIFDEYLSIGFIISGTLLVFGVFLVFVSKNK